jgi:hypothetical protein
MRFSYWMLVAVFLALRAMVMELSWFTNKSLTSVAACSTKYVSEILPNGF